MRTWAAILAALFCLAAPLEARAEGESATPQILGVTGAALAGLSLYFAYESSIAGGHEQDPSETREGLATVFSVVSISTLALAVVSWGVAVVLKLTQDDGPTTASTVAGQGRVVRIWCPELSCLPGGS